MKTDYVILCLVFALGFSIGGLVVSLSKDYSLHREAITHHAAQFNPQTGKFQWLDEKEKK